MRLMLIIGLFVGGVVAQSVGPEAVSSVPLAEGSDLPAIHLWKEAERTRTLRPALIESRFNSDPVSASALCGAYVGVRVGDDGTVVGRASYTFDVPREGRYYLWARVMTLSGAPQSNLGVVVDGVDVGSWGLAADPDWRWAALGDHQATPGMHLASGERHLELVFQTPGTNVDSILLTSDALFDPAPKGNPNCDNSWVEAWNQRKIEVYAALTPDERYLADAGRTAFNGDIFAPVSTVRALANSNQSRFRGEVASSRFRLGPFVDSSAPTVVLEPAAPLVSVAGARFGDLAFGASVAVGGGTLMVAAAGVGPPSGRGVGPLEPAGRSSVYVYERQVDGSWLLSQRLVPPYEWARNRQVWTSVVLEGDTAVVVADSGFAFVYRREGGAWRLTARLAAKEAGEFFSGPVALEGRRIALASRIERICHRDPSCLPSSVYLFRWLDGTWQREARLDVVGLGQRVNPKTFGSSLALAGDRLAASYTAPEVVSVFEPDVAGVWREVQRLDSGREDPLLGPQHVAMDADTLVHSVVRAMPDRVEEGVSARLRIFERGEDGWLLQRELTLPMGGRHTRIQSGAAVALHGDVLVVGSHRAQEGGLGVVYTLVRSPEGWVLRQRIAHRGADGSKFGYAVALDGDHVVVGRPGSFVDGAHPSLGLSAGAAYVYEIVR